MFRTNASKQPVPPDLAWKRLRTLERDIKTTILPKMKAVMDSEEGNGKSHEELCELMLQREYVSFSSKRRSNHCWSQVSKCSVTSFFGRLAFYRKK